MADLSQYDPAINAAAQEWGHDPDMLRALIMQESGGKPGLTSSAGAGGLTQILPKTATGLGITDPADPTQQIFGAAKYLAEGQAKEGSPEGALLYYHGGPDWRKGYGPESRGYVPGVAAKYTALKGAGSSAETVPSDDEFLKQAAPSQPPTTTVPSDAEFLQATGAAPPPGPPAETSGGGIASNAAAGALDAAGNVINTVSNPSGNLIGKPLATAGVFLHDLIAPYVGGQKFPDDVRNMLLADNVPQTGTQAAGLAANALGLNNVTANTQAEKLTRAGVGGAVNMLALGPGGMAAPVIGAAGGVAGSLAGQAAPEWAKPAAELAGNILGGAAAVPALAGVNALKAGVNRLGNGPSDPAIASSGPSSTPLATAAVPKTAAEAKTIASAYYDKAQQGGGTLTPAFANKFVDAAQRLAPQSSAGMAVSGETPITALASRLESLRNQPITLQGAQEIDEALSGLIDKEYGMKGLSKDGKHLFDLQSDFRNMIQNAGPDDVHGGAGGFDALAQGRRAWAQAMKMGDLERIQQRAEGTDNPATGIKSGIRTLLNNPSRVRGYSPDEIAALQQAQSRGIVGGALHVFGSRLIPQAAAVGGFFGGGPVGAVLGGAAAHFGTTALRSGATAIQSNRLANAMATLGKGVPPNPLSPP